MATYQTELSDWIADAKAKLNDVQYSVSSTQAISTPLYKYFTNGLFAEPGHSPLPDFQAAAADTAKLDIWIDLYGDTNRASIEVIGSGSILITQTASLFCGQNCSINLGLTAYGPNGEVLTTSREASAETAQNSTQTVERKIIGYFPYTGLASGVWTFAPKVYATVISPGSVSISDVILMYELF